MPVFTAITLKDHLQLKSVGPNQRFGIDEALWAYVRSAPDSPFDCGRECQSPNLERRVDADVVAIS